MQTEPQRHLRDSVEATLTDDRHHYVLPDDRDTVRRTVDALGRALERLAPFATTTDADDHDSIGVAANRRFRRVFYPAFDHDPGRIDDHELPTIGRIFSEMRLTSLLDGPAHPRTITITKAEDTLELTYEEGFHATDETVTVPAAADDDLLKDRVRYCGQGVADIHAPYNPSMFEAWRYGPSEVQVSMAVDDESLRLGLAQTRPDAPYWYTPYLWVTQLGGPHAHATFDMAAQTSVVQYYSSYGDA